jgi:hypothetical protein
LLYGTVDYLLLWMRRPGAPPLASTGPLGAPGTTVLLDGLPFEDGERQGGRLNLGTWLNRGQTVAVEATLWGLGQRSPSAFLNSTGSSPLAVPFFNAATGAPDAFVLAAPGTRTGSVAAQEVSRFDSGEVNLRARLGQGSCFHLDALLGVRAMDLDEALEVTTFSSTTAGGTTATSDRYHTRNVFVGGQAGLEAGLQRGRLFADGWARLALGDNHERADVNGTTLVTTAAGGKTATAGGLFAVPGVIGSHTRDELAFVPEVGVNLGCQVSDHLRAFAGYTFLYVDNVVRPGDQINHTVGGSTPGFSFAGTDVWLQGVSVGLEFRF